MLFSRRPSQPGQQHPRSPMALLLSLLTALVVFSAGPGGALGCDLPLDHILLSRDNLELLNQMSTISPVFCMKDRKDFRFPRATVDGSQVQKAQAIAVLHEMLQQVSNLLSTENSSVTWNTTLVGQLRSGLHRQLEDLEACLVEEMGEKESVLAMQGPPLALKRYFQGIRLYPTASQREAVMPFFPVSGSGSGGTSRTKRPDSVQPPNTLSFQPLTPSTRIPGGNGLLGASVQKESPTFLWKRSEGPGQCWFPENNVRGRRRQSSFFRGGSRAGMECFTFTIKAAPGAPRGGQRFCSQTSLTALPQKQLHLRPPARPLAATGRSALSRNPRKERGC